MKVKRIIFALLVAVMVFSLVGCGQKSDLSESDVVTSTNEGATKGVNTPRTNVQVGEVISIPEKTIDVYSFTVGFVYPDEAEENGEGYMTLTLNDDVVPGILYVAKDINKTEEAVYEMSEDGNVTKYLKGEDGKFEKVDGDEQSLNEEATSLQDILSSLGYAYSMEADGLEYRKCPTEEMPFTGDAYVYELLIDGVASEKIWVDTDTGFVVKCEDADGVSAFEVQLIETQKIDIPEYK